MDPEMVHDSQVPEDYLEAWCPGLGEEVYDEGEGEEEEPGENDPEEEEEEVEVGVMEAEEQVEKNESPKKISVQNNESSQPEVVQVDDVEEVQPNQTPKIDEDSGAGGKQTPQRNEEVPENESKKEENETSKMEDVTLAPPKKDDPKGKSEKVIVKVPPKKWPSIEKPEVDGPAIPVPAAEDAKVDHADTGRVDERRQSSLQEVEEKLETDDEKEAGSKGAFKDSAVLVLVLCHALFGFAVSNCCQLSVVTIKGFFFFVWLLGRTPLL